MGVSFSLFTASRTILFSPALSKSCNPTAPLGITLSAARGVSASSTNTNLFAATTSATSISPPSLTSEQPTPKAARALLLQLCGQLVRPLPLPIALLEETVPLLAQCALRPLCKLQAAL